MNNSVLQAETKATVMLVDDTSQNLVLMTELLREDYRILVANGGERALTLLGSETLPDLILLDVMMPDLDGHEVLRRIKANPATCDIPVIFLTAKSDLADEILGLQLGAVDYITKPISAPIVQARVRTHLALKAAADFLRDKSVYLESEVTRRTRQLSAIQDVTVLAMSSMAETRDNETGNHILRTQRYVKRLALQLQEHPRFSQVMGDAYIDLLFKSAPLHDIGKVGIPDHILLKPGPLTAAEFEVMKTHTTIGFDSIVRAEKALGVQVDFLMLAKEIALSHQEKWDGSGYPQGLVGDAIPLSARLMAVADVYDALISKRVYKDAMTHEQAMAIMGKGRGSHFDPDILDTFFDTHEDFRAIAAQYTDEGI
jgi:putative two-component system response regulator